MGRALGSSRRAPSRWGHLQVQPPALHVALALPQQLQLGPLQQYCATREFELLARDAGAIALSQLPAPPMTTSASEFNAIRVRECIAVSPSDGDFGFRDAETVLPNADVCRGCGARRQ